MRILVVTTLAALVAATGCSTSRLAKSPAISAADRTMATETTLISPTVDTVNGASQSDSDREVVTRLPQATSSEVRRVNYTQDAELPAPIPDTFEVLEAPAPDQSSLAQLEQMALAANPALRQAAGRIDSLRGKWVQVGLYPNPNAGYLASEVGNDGRGGQQGGFVSQTIITGGKLHLSREIVAQEIIMAEQQLAVMEQRVLTDIRMAYYDALAAQTKESIAADLVSLANKAVSTTEELIKAEEVGRHVLLQAEVEVNAARIAQQQAETQRRAAARRIAALTGDAHADDIRVAGSLNGVDEEIAFDEALSTIATASPEIAAAWAELGRAQAALDRASVQYKPDIDANLSVQYDNASEYTIAGVQISIPLPIYDRNQGGVQQAIGEIVVAEQRMQRVQVGLQTRLAPVYADYAAARFQVDQYRREVLPKAKENYELLESAYKAGEIDFLSLLTAQRTYFQSNLAYIEALRQLRLKQAEMKGLLLSTSLEQDP